MPYRNLPPIIETVETFEFHVDCVLRMDRIGQKAVIHYASEQIDPLINNGQLFLTPVGRVIWPVEKLLSGRGQIFNWLASGPPEGSLVMPWTETARRLMLS